MRRYLGHMVALGVALVAVLVYSSTFVVNEWEQVVVTEFGRPVGEPILEAGLHLKKPFVQEVHRFDKRLLRWDGKPHETFSKDRKTILIDVTARWRIGDPLKFLQSVRSVSAAHRRLDGIIESAVKNTLAKYDLFEVVRSTNRLYDQQRRRRVATMRQTFGLVLSETVAAGAAGVEVEEIRAHELWEGLEAGDRIVAVDGTEVGHPSDIYQLLKRRRGKKVSFDLVRAGWDAPRSSGELRVPEDHEVALAATEAGEVEASLKDVDFLGSDVEELTEGVGRQHVMEEILEDARRELSRKDVDLGINIEDILVKALVYTKDVETQVYRQMNAELKRWSTRFRSIGHAKAEEKRGEMAQELAAIKSSAVMESLRIQGEGDAEALKIYAKAYERDVELYTFLELLKGYREALKNHNHVLVIPPDGPFFQLLTSGRIDSLLERFRELPRSAAPEAEEATGAAPEAGEATGAAPEAEEATGAAPAPTTGTSEEEPPK